MHIPLWTTLPYAARHNGPVLIERTNPWDVCLPVQLQAAVPSCAYQCLQTFIVNNYNVLDCTSTANINFLCTNPTYSGLTIGEGSLQCVISNCLGVDIQTQSGYNVCDGIMGALPETAGTITATISAVTTFLSSSETSIASATSTPAASSTSSIFSSTTSSQILETSLSDLTTPFTTFTSSASSLNNPSSTLEMATGSSTTTSGSIPTTAPSSDSPIGSSVVTSSISATTSIATRTSASSSNPLRSATSSATAAAATENATESELGTSAIAGIVTAVVLVVASILGFLAYWCCIRRRERKRRSQRFSTAFRPNNGYSPTGSTSVNNDAQGGLFKNSTRRSYSRESSQDKRASFWRRSAALPNNIGIAVAPSTRVSPERQINTQVPQQSYIPWPSPALGVRIDRDRAPANTGRWSPSDFSDDDVEAQAQIQNQDLPALASPKTRRSSRSASSIGVEKPAPLQLNKLKAHPDARGIIPLTPVYDNGTFESTIRQVVEDSSQPAGLIRLSRERQTPNFSRREPSLTRTSQDEARSVPPTSQSMNIAGRYQPMATAQATSNSQNVPFQVRPPNAMTRFPVKPMAPPRKESETTDRSMSVHTEFDEDSTPEDEEDKQLRPPRQVQLPSRVPLNTIQYPRIPRPAATRRQAEIPHSPGALTIRRVDPNLDPSPLQSYATHARVPARAANLTNINISSNSSLDSRSTESPVFPTPPPRNPARLTPHQSQQRIRSQITDAYRVASRPLTTTSMSSTSTRPNIEFPPSAYPGAVRYGGPYDSPSLQRLSGGRDRGRGRPLANRMQAQGYMPRPPIQREMQMQMPMPAAALNPRNARRPAMGPRDGDLYFTVGDVGR